MTQGDPAPSPAPGNGADPHPEVEGVSIATLASSWLENTKARYRLTTELAFAEAKLAVTTAILMALLGVVAVVFLLTAWGLLVAGIVNGLVQLGLPLWVALVSLGLLHVLAAWGLWRWAMHMSRHMEFRETRQQLRPGRSEP